MKKLWIGLSLVILSAVIVVLTAGNLARSRYLVVATNFPAYDFARAVVGEGNVKMLLPAGSDIHHYEPTPQDLVTIDEAKLFVYNGGESEEWVKDIIGERNPESVIKMMDLVENLTEEPEDLSSHEYDEHVWTNPLNAVTIIRGIADSAAALWPEKSEEYYQNAEDYIVQIRNIDGDFREVVQNGNRKLLVFGDRFPFSYFVNEYGLDYLAVFPGCSEETEPDAKTVASIIDKVKKENIPVILKLELSSGSVAENIANETGAKVLEFNSAHNISKEDFKAHKTYADIMRENVETLREALK